MSHADQTPEARPSGFANGQWQALVACWVVLLGGAMAGAALLQALGSPLPIAASKPPMAVHPVVAAPHPGAGIATKPALLAPPPAKPAPPVRANTAPSPSFEALLAQAETEIAPSQSAPDSNSNAAKALKQVAAALPNASPVQAQHARELASALFSRAKAALAAGQVEDEQRWLALGAILAPPPNLHQGVARSAARPPERVAEARQTAGAASTATDANGDRRDAAAPAVAVPPAAAEPRSPLSPPATAAFVTPAAAQADTRPGSPKPQEADVGHGAPLPLQAEAPGSLRAGTGAEQAAALVGRANLATAGQVAPPAVPGIRYMVDYPAGSPEAEQTAKTLAARLGASLEGAGTHSAAGTARVAVIRYAGEDAHVAARELGRMLGSLGYSWRIGRLPADGPWQSTVQVWIPSERHGRRD